MPKRRSSVSVDELRRSSRLAGRAPPLRTPRSNAQVMEIVDMGTMTEGATSGGMPDHSSIRRFTNPSEMAARKKAWTNKGRKPSFKSGRYGGRGDYTFTPASVGNAIRTIGRYVVPEGTFSRIGATVGGGVGAAGGAAVGNVPGGYIGGLAGGALGGAAGSKFAKIVGFGDYQIGANTLMDVPMGQGMASFGDMSNATIVSHREYIQDVVVPTDPTAFNVQTLNMNPALRGVFPWLSAVAGSYQEYQFIGAVFEYRSLSSDSANTLPMGSIIIASNYDTADPPYPDKRHMENSQFCVSGKPSVGLIHPIECDPKISFSPLKYTRTGAGAANTDNRLYDHCNVMVATEGIAGVGGQVIGEIWVTYEVALYKPQLGIAAALRDHFYGDSSNVGLISTVNPLGLLAASLAPRGGTANGLGIKLTPTQIIFPAGTAPGDYEVSVIWAGAAGFASAPATFSPLPLTGLVLSNYYVNQTESGLNSPFPNSANSIRHSIFFHVTVKNPLTVAAAVTIGGTFGSAPTFVETQVASLPALQI